MTTPPGHVPHLACSAGAAGPRPAASPTSCAPRPSAGRCWSARRSSRWSGRTPRGATPTPRLSGLRVGPAALHLDLTLAQWAADGLLAIFFFVAGLELKREFVAGDLRDPRRAALPVAAAVGGMAVPAADLRRRQPRRGRRRAGRAGRSRPRPTSPSPSPCSPVISTHLPAALRTFLLTLAVVDDLLAIIDHRRLLHRLPAARCRCRWRWSRSGCSRCWCSAGCGPGGCCCRWPPPPGRWCTTPGCTPPSPECCSGSPCR